MLDFEAEKVTQKIGEILVIGSSNSSQSSFLYYTCPKVMKSDQDIMFGQLEIEQNLHLFLYGISSNGAKNNIAWDLIDRKMLGYIIVFNWFDEKSYELAKKNIDFLHIRFDAPLIIAADIIDKSLPIKKTIINPFISLSNKDKFTFFNSTSAGSVKSVLSSLIDVVSEYAI